MQQIYTGEWNDGNSDNLRTGNPYEATCIIERQRDEFCMEVSLGVPQTGWLMEHPI